MGKLTRTHRRLLGALAQGGWLTAIYQDPEDFLASGRFFYGHSPGAKRTSGPLLHTGDGSTMAVAPRTAQRMVEAGHIDHADGASGIREFRITPAGRAALDGGREP